MSIWTDASPRSETDAIGKPVIQTVPGKLCVCFSLIHIPSSLFSTYAPKDWF